MKIWLLCLLFYGVLVAPAFANEGASFEGFRLMEIAAPDQRAVFLSPNGEMRVYGVGDQLADRISVLEITDGKVVLESLLDVEPERIIFVLGEGQAKVLRVKKMILKRSAPVKSVR